MTNKIARALLIGERFNLYIHKRIEYGMGCIREDYIWDEVNYGYGDATEFAEWLESPDGLKAVRDALSIKWVYTLYLVRDLYGRSLFEFIIRGTWSHEDNRKTECKDFIESEAILTATEAFLNDQVD